MARRKANKGYLSDGDSSGNSSDGGDEDWEADGDARAERDRFDDPYSTKKRKRGGKEEELYGVFAEDDEDEGFSGGRGKGNAQEKRTDWTKAPSFAQAGSSSSAAPPPLSNLAGNEVEGIPDFVPMPSSRPNQRPNTLAGGEDEDGMEPDSSDGSDEEDESRAPSPRVRDDDSEDEDAPAPVRGFGARAGGIGSAPPPPPADTAITEPPRQRAGGIGFGSAPRTGGIGFAAHTTTLPSTIPDTLATPSYASSSYSNAPPPSSNLPASFGAAPPPSRPRASFLPKAANAPSAPPVALSKEDAQAFRKMEGSFGARMLAKQGWATGTGLGAGASGIITPVESKLRPRAMGIGHNGFRERTDQSKKEAIRRGDEVDSDEERKKAKKANRDAAAKGGRKGEADGDDSSTPRKDKDQPWRKPKKVKIRVEHKSYEEIIAEAGQNNQSSAGVGMIIDATGATPREISSLAGMNMSSWTPTSDTTRLPELRHNLRMICDMTKGDLDALAKEGASVAEKRKWLAREDENLKHRVVEEAKKIARLQKIHLLIDEVSSITKTLSSSYEPSLDAFVEPFDRLLFEFADEYAEYALDEVVVGAIAPALRRLVSSWSPLTASTELFASLRRWKKAFRFSDPDKAEDEAVQLFGGGGGRGKRAIVEDLVMTPYESLMWNVWLPKVRSAINNDWSPDEPAAAVQLLETWIPLLPRFLHDNILDQLILPKVNKAVSDWKPRKGGVSLQGIVFPWLPFLGDRMDEVLGDAKRRVRGMLKGWKVEDRVPEELRKWKDVFTPTEWDSLILKYILPKLGAHLRDDFKINPRAQILTPLTDHVLPWSSILRPSMLSQLLETEFFPKWLEILYIWLIQPKPNFDEVTQWYSYWKSVFPMELHSELKGLGTGFKRGLDLMNQAMALGASAPTKLQRPDTAPTTSLAPSLSAPAKTTKTRRPEQEEITFRSLAESFVAKHDLVWVPTGRSDVNTGQMLIRVSTGAGAGVLCYVEGDAVYVGLGQAEGGGFRAVTLEELVKRAKGGK